LQRVELAHDWALENDLTATEWCCASLFDLWSGQFHHEAYLKFQSIRDSKQMQMRQRYRSDHIHLSSAW
jgi:hypothetical protein